MKKEVRLSAHEMELLHDRDFLLTKIEIDTKITDLLIAHQEEMQDFFSQYKSNLPKSLSYTVSKVNKGQNLKGLPYWVIDLPSNFDGENIFTYRTIIWWGNHISFHLIVKGQYLKHLNFNFTSLENKSIYYGVGDSPWEVDFKPNNLILVDSLSTEAKQIHTEKSFFKLSVKFGLERIKDMTVLSKGTFEQIYDSLNWLNI